MRKVLTLALLCSVFLFSGIASAVTIHVPADQPTIQAGLDAASYSDTVLVATGVYLENITMRDGVVLMSDAGAASTTINGQEIGRVITCSNIGSDARIRGFTITGGNADVDGFDPHLGGGILCRASSLEIHENVLIGNTAISGAGVFAHWNSTPVLYDNEFKGNVASGGGGGFYCSGYGTDPILRDNLFHHNLAPVGAGIALRWGEQLVEGNTIEYNTSMDNGGGIWIDNGAIVTLVDNVIRWNESTEGCGGGLYSYTCVPTILNNEFTGNEAMADGGAIYIVGGASTIEGNLVADNTAVWGDGGGLLVRSNVYTISQNTFAGNSAQEGGNVYISYETDGTVSNNIICTSPTGGGIYKATTLYEPSVECNDIWGNHPYNYMNLMPAVSNFSENPMFCDPVLGNYQLCVNSPCVNGYGCGQVGAFGVGCGWTLVKQTTWSSLKAAYR